MLKEGRLSVLCLSASPKGWSNTSVSTMTWTCALGLPWYLHKPLWQSIQELHDIIHLLLFYPAPVLTTIVAHLLVVRVIQPSRAPVLLWGTNGMGQSRHWPNNGLLLGCSLESKHQLVPQATDSTAILPLTSMAMKHLYHLLCMWTCTWTRKGAMWDCCSLTTVQQLTL